jgi:hypothetical protein
MLSMRTPIHEFPWPIGFGLVGFFIAFFVQFRLRHHIDREKVLQIEDMSELFPNSVPPKKILTERGQRLYFWFTMGIGIFFASIVLTMIIYGK